MCNRGETMARVTKKKKKKKMAILWGWSSFHEDSPLFIKAAIFTRMESVVEGKLGKGDSRLNEIPFHPSRLFANPHVKIAENLPSSSRLFSQTFRTTTSKTWRKQVRNSNISIRFGFFERYIFLSLFFFLQTRNYDEREVWRSYIGGNIERGGEERRDFE